MDAEVIQRAFKNANDENGEYDIVFRAYDDELLKGVENLLLSIKNEVRKYYVSNSPRSAYEDLFRSKYKDLSNEQNAIMLWYLGQVGIRTENNFVSFMKLELPNIKRQIKEEKIYV